MKKAAPAVTLAAAALIYAATTFPSSKPAHDATAAIDDVTSMSAGGFVRTANDPRSYMNGGFAPDREFALERARQHARGSFEAPGTLIATNEDSTGSPETGTSPH